MKKIIKIFMMILVIIIVVVGVVIFLNNKANNVSSTSNIEYNYYKYYNNEKFGVIDKLGNILIEANYDDIIIPNPQYSIFFLLENGEISKVLNEKNEKLFEKYEGVMPISLTGLIGEIPYEKNFLIYKQNDKLGLLNFEGKEITKSIYQTIESVPYKEGEFLCERDNSVVVLNKDGKEKVELEKEVEVVSDGYYDENYNTDKAGYIISKQTNQGILYGYIDYNGKQLLDFEYDEIKRLKTVDENLIVKKNGQYGLYKGNKAIINCNYQEMKYNDNLNMLFVKRTNNKGVLTLKGDLIVPVEYNSIEDKGIFLEAITQNNQTKRFDLEGKETTEFDEYSSIERSKYDNTYIAITTEYLYEILDNNYSVLTTEKYEYIENILKNLYIVKDKKGKYGVIDINNQKIIKNEYDVAQIINSSKVLQVMDIEKNITALFDENGKKIFEEKDALVILENGYIKVFCNEGVKYFTFDAKEISNKEIYKNNNIIGFFENDKWGFKDKNGNIIIEAKYDRISEINANGYGGIKIEEKWGIVDSNGNIIVEPKFYIDDNMSEPEFLNKFYKSYYASSGAFYIE